MSGDRGTLRRTIGPYPEASKGRRLPDDRSDSDGLDALIADVLCGQAVSWPAAPHGVTEEAFLRRARHHGVAVLLNESGLQNRNWPRRIVDALRADAIHHAMWELGHQQVLSRLVAACAETNIKLLFFKGTALAYDIYANPVWRSRCDTDLLVAPYDLVGLRDILQAQGFIRGHALPGAFTSNEESWTLEGREGATHALDVHRKINNSEVLACLFTHDELFAAARPLPALCAGAYGLSLVHALLIACVHRVAHTADYTDGVPGHAGNRLIWLYDIHLISSALSQDDWQAFVGLARAKGIAAVCLDGLLRATSTFGDTVPPVVMSALAQPARERSAIYLKAGRLRREWMDFTAREGGLNKATFLKELVFPPETYLRATYPDAGTSSLISLLVRRATRGVAKRLRIGS